MLKADLHMHSTVSDGSDEIESLIAKAVLNGLDVIAITDHDTLAHRKKIPESNPIQVLAGIEISAIDPGTGTKAHILGYRLEEPELVESLTHPLLKRRHENSLRQIQILKEHGYALDVEALKKADGRYIYKQHIMEQLYRTGQVNDMFGSFYTDTFKNGGICDFDIEYTNVFEAVDVITQAGGKAVLAHCGQQQNFYLIDRLAPLGLCGLEYNHPGNSAKDREVILEYAKKHRLFLTGGSDYHGANEKVRRRIGDFLSEASGVLALC